MKRDIAIAILLGITSTYLPFWILDSGLDRIVCAMGIGVVAFIVLLATEKEKS